MTSPKRSLLPASGDDRRALLCALEFVAGVDLQFGEVAGAVVRQRMALEPRPQIFDGVEVGRTRRQEGDLDVPLQRVEIFSNQSAAVRPQPIPDHQQRRRKMRLECFQEGDNLFLLDTALVQSEQIVVAGKPGNDRDVIPVEMELDDWRLSLGRPGAHTGRPFADARFVDEDD